MTDAAKLRGAYHEAAHAVIAELLGLRVEVVSIRSGQHHRGVTIRASSSVSSVTEIPARREGSSLLARWGVRPYPLFDPEERRRDECSIMVALAGYLGELLAPEHFTGRVEDTTAEDEQWAIAVAAELTAKQASWLHDAEHHEIPLDDDAAFETARWNIGEEAAGGLVNYLSWETRRLVFSRLVRRLVPLVVDELLRHEVIPGETVREIMESITGETLEHEEAGTMVQVAAKQVDPNTPRIAGDTPLSQLVVCMRAIIRSEAGPCAEGVITTVDDPRVAIAPDCFSPLTDRIDGLFSPLTDRIDG